MIEVFNIKLQYIDQTLLTDHMAEIILDLFGKKISDMSLSLLGDVTVKYVKANYHYGLPNELNEKIEKVEHMMIDFCNAHMNSMIEHFKIAISSYKIKKVITDAIKREFEKSRDQGIIAFGMVRNDDYKVLITKVIIISSFFVFNTDIDILGSSVDSALNKLISIDKVRTSVCDNNLECWWHLWKDKRKLFVEDIQNIVLQSKQLLATLLKIHKNEKYMKQLEVKIDDQFDEVIHGANLENNIDKCIEQLCTDFSLDSFVGGIECHIDPVIKYKYHFLFMYKIENILTTKIFVIKDKLIILDNTPRDNYGTQLLICECTTTKNILTLNDFKCEMILHKDVYVQDCEMIENKDDTVKVLVKCFHKCISNPYWPIEPVKYDKSNFIITFENKSLDRYYHEQNVSITKTDQLGGETHCILQNGIIIKENPDYSNNHYGKLIITTYIHSDDYNCKVENIVKTIDLRKEKSSDWCIRSIRRIYKNLLVMTASDGIYIVYPDNGHKLTEKNKWNMVKIFKPKLDNYWYSPLRAALQVIDDRIILIPDENTIKILIPRFSLEKLESCLKLNDKFFDYHIECLYGTDKNIEMIDQLHDGRIISVSFGEIYVWGNINTMF